MVAVDPLKPASFPEPHTWSSWVGYRSERYKTHPSIGALKNAVGYFFDSNGVAKCDIRIYSYDATNECEWVQIFHIKKGDVRADHPLWQTTVKRQPIKGPSDKQVERALASIARAATNVKE